MNTWFLYSNEKNLDIKNTEVDFISCSSTSIPSCIRLYNKEIQNDAKLHCHKFNMDICNNNIIIISTINELIDFAASYTVFFNKTPYTNWRKVIDSCDAIVILNYDYIKRILNLERNINFVKSVGWFMNMDSDFACVYNTDILIPIKELEKIN